jgi:hypothetical protein
MLSGDYIFLGTRFDLLHTSVFLCDRVVLVYSEWTQAGESGIVFNEGEKVYLKGFIGLNRDVLNAGMTFAN